jgi:flagellar hook assembly protein FlgD
VRLWIVNALGQSVRVLVDGSLPAGVHGVSWDGRDDAGRPAAWGVYFHRLQTPTGGDLGTMTLLR